MFCSNCGSKLPEGARFCSTCGARVAEIFEVPEVEEKPAAFGFTAKAPDPEAVKPAEAPLKKRATFDWSNVIDEPKKKTIPDIKSPWANTGGVDEKQLYAEMGASTERSRTMSFIDVLKAEKEQQEAAKTEAPAVAEPVPAAKPAEEKRPFEYTEVLDPGFLEPEAPAAEVKKEEEIPQLHIAPLYEDVDAPVVTPFDVPEEEKEPAAPADEVQITETVEAEAPAEPAAEAVEPAAAPADTSEEPAAEIYIEETVEEEAPEAVEETAEEVIAETEIPAADELNVEAAAPIVEEEPVKPRRGWFDLPDFLKPKEERRPFAAFTEEEPEEIPAAETPAEEPAEEVVLEEPAAPAEEVVFEEPEFEDAEETSAEELGIAAPGYEPEAKLEDEIDSILRGGSGLMGHDTEEEEVEAEPAEEEDGIFEGDLYNNTEDEYLNIYTEPVSGGDKAEAEEAGEEEEEDKPVDEQELFADMTENSPKHTGMTIAPPADKEAEIEALKKRLAELMGTSWEPAAEEPAAEETVPEAPAAEEAAPVEEAQTEEPAEQDYYFRDPEPAAEEPAEVAPAYEEYDHADLTQYEEPVNTAAYEDAYLTAEHAEEAPEEAAEPAAEEAAPAVEAQAEEPVSTYEHLVLTPEEPVEAIPGAESKIIQAAEAAAHAAEPEVTETVEYTAAHAAPEPAEEEAPASEPAIEDFYLMDYEPSTVAEEKAPEESFVFEAPAAEEAAHAAEEPAEEPAAAEPEKAEEEIIFSAPEAEAEEIVFTAPEVTAEEDKIIFEAPEPEVAAEPEPVVVPEPETVAEPEPEVEHAPKTIDDFLADILREGAAPAAEETVKEATEPVVEAAAAEPVVEAVAAEPASAAPAFTLEDLVPSAEATVAEEAAPEVPEVKAEDKYSDEVVLTAADLEVPSFKEAPEAPALTLEDLVPSAEEATVVEEAAPEAPAAEEITIPAVEAAVEAPAPEKKETDALSIEELEQDLFGSSPAPETEVEATKKIDKFYTLYRKNEEFQRLLDEEYNKLKAAGGPTPEPVLPDPEPKEVKHKKIEDATIYQDFDLEKEAAKLRAEQEKAGEVAADAKEAGGSAAAVAAGTGAAVATGVAVAAETGKKLSRKEKKAAEKAAKAAEKAAKAAEKDDSLQLDYDEVEKGGGCLTVLAVIIAILLIILLGVILVLNFMPDSSIALRIDSIIENITSHFTAVDVMGKTLLL